jgi:hypothetical protein
MPLTTQSKKGVMLMSKDEKNCSLWRAWSIWSFRLGINATTFEISFLCLMGKGLRYSYHFCKSRENQIESLL